VEKLAGKSLFDFLNERIFKELDAFQTATILKTKTDDSFGDSALLCTTRDMATFARFVMNYGIWNGKRLMNEEYLRTATSPVVCNDTTGFASFESLGYGYQIWSLGKKGFFFNGMGCQVTICLPEKDLIFTITGDNQGYPAAKMLIYTAFNEIIVEHLEDRPLPEDSEARESCKRLGASLQLQYLPGDTESAYAQILNGKTYRCQENPMGITRFSLQFTSGDTGELHYTNNQGDKVLHFGLGKNVFGKFPQYGYSDLHAGAPSTGGFLYDCAASAAWREDQKLQIKVQIIDKYFGNMLATFSFREDCAVVTMTKTAEDFLKEYTGTLVAKVQ